MMNISELSILYPLAATFAVFLIYCYLYIQYHQRYIGLWAFSWALYLIRFVFLDTPLHAIAKVPLILYVFTVIWGSLIMLIGTSIFVGAPFKKVWYLGALITYLISVIFVLLDMPFCLTTLPVCLLLAFIYCKNGLLFIKSLDVHGLGKYITGVSFIILGLHLLDLPFLITVEWFAPWGFVIDSVFRFLVAVGTLIVYFEKTRNDLIIKEEYYRLLADNASDVIYRYKLSPNKGFEYISPSIYNLTGYRPEQFYQSKKLILSLIYPKDRPILKMFIRNPTYTDQLITLRLIKKDKSIIWIEQKSVPLQNSAGNCIGFDCIVRDITSRKNLELDVSRLDRLNAVGQMAASVAHEIRNPMTTVRGYIQYFASKNEFLSYKNQFGLMIEELDRTNLIIKEYLSLSQHRIIDLKLTCLNDIINALYPLIKADANAANKDVELSLTPTSDLYLDEKEIRQLILNLARNGLEAMDIGGILKISTSTESDGVVLAIQDNGPGIPHHILENIGKPFLTTKDTGTGLGLAICYRIANRHQAKIHVESSTEGTTFFIHFKQFDK